MSLRDLLRLGSLLNRRTRRRLFAANAGLALGAALVVLFAAAGSGLRQIVLHDLLGSLPLDQLKVQAESLDIGFLRLGKPRLLGGGKLDAEALGKLAAIPGVRRVHPIAYARFPVSLHGDVLGSRYGTDAPMQGVDSAWVADEIAEGYHFTAADEPTVPLLVSRKVLQAYNLGFAAANRLPRLSEKAVIGQEVSVSLGASSLAGSAYGAIVRPGVVVGFSDRIDALGVAVPIELIAAATEQLTGEALNAYDEAILVATSPRELPRIEAAVRKLGFQITPESQIPKQVGGAISAATVVLSAIGLVVVGLALANIANTLALILGERRYELAVVRAVGVSERLLRTLLVGEAVVAGFLAAIVALGASWLALQIGARSLSGVLESLTGAAPRFPIPAALALGVLVGTPIASFIAALVPAIRVTAPSIATALRR